MENETSFKAVLKNSGFLNLWLNQILVQLAYNALNFALIIWVFNLTESNTAVSFLLLAVYLPAVLFGLFAGILVDITDRKKIILVVNILLCLLFIALIFLKQHYLAILVITFLVNTLAQIYNPAEASAIPIICKKSQLLTANSLFSMTLFSSFLIGFALAGPFINHFGINSVFEFGAVSLFLAFLLAFKFPPIVSKTGVEGERLIKAFFKIEPGIIKKIVSSEIRETLLLIKKNLTLTTAIFIMAGVQVVIGILAVLIPSFFEKVVNIKATDSSQVLILPLGIGMILGGFLIGKIGHKFPKRSLVSKAILAAGLLFFLMGAAPLITPVIKYFPQPKPLPFFTQLPLSSVLALGSFLLGAAMVSIVVPTQTVLQEKTPEKVRGKIFSVLGAVMAGMSLLPVLLAGILADIFGPMPIFIGLGGSIALLGLLALKPDFYFEKKHLPFKIRRFLGLGHWIKRK